MVDTKRKQIVVPTEAAIAMKKLARKLSNGNESNLYRRAVGEFLARHGIDIDMNVQVGNPLLLEQRNTGASQEAAND